MVGFVINEAAVKKKLSYVKDTISNYMTSKNIPFELAYTLYPDHATQIANEMSNKGYEKIIAVGGDGTVLETVSGLYGSKSTFGVLPMGSGNDFVRSIGMKGFNIFDALDVIRCGDIIKADLISVNDRHYINIASVGIDASIVKTSQKIKDKFKGFSYLLSTVSNIFTFKCFNATLKIDNRVIDGEFILIAAANGKYYGGGFMIAPIANVNDGFISVCAIEKMPNIQMLFVFPSILLGRHSFLKQVSFYKGKEIEIKLDDELDLNLDGNIYEPSKDIRFQIKENAINLLVPKKAN